VSYNRGVPYRIPAPPAPEPEEAEHPYAAVLRAQRRRGRSVTAALVIVLAGGVAIAKVARSGAPPRRLALTEAVVLEAAGGARQTIDHARGRAHDAQAQFEQRVREAVGLDLAPRPDLGECPIALPAASTLSTGHAPAFPLLTLERVEIAATLPSQAVAGVLADVRRAEAHLASGRIAEATLYGRALDRPERFGYEVVLLARTSKRPRALSGNAYEPGEIDGRAFLYDFASNRVVCAGDVHAKSSKGISYTFSERVDAPVALGPTASMSEAIDDDMRLQTERAIIESLRWRAGPPELD